MASVHIFDATAVLRALDMDLFKRLVCLHDVVYNWCDVCFYLKKEKFCMDRMIILEKQWKPALVMLFQFKQAN